MAAAFANPMARQPYGCNPIACCRAVPRRDEQRVSRGHFGYQLRVIWNSARHRRRGAARHVARRSGKHQRQRKRSADKYLPTQPYLNGHAIHTTRWSPWIVV
jgi:hypothetical protein